MTDKQIIKKIENWLKANLKIECFNLNIYQDNEALLKAIKGWKSELKK